MSAFDHDSYPYPFEPIDEDRPLSSRHDSWGRTHDQNMANIYGRAMMTMYEIERDERKPAQKPAIDDYEPGSLTRFYHPPDGLPLIPASDAQEQGSLTNFYHPSED